MTETRCHGLFPPEGFHSILDQATSANGLTTTPKTSSTATRSPLCNASQVSQALKLKSQRQPNLAHHRTSNSSAFGRRDGGEECSLLASPRKATGP